jgi:glycosyltransferase involved in cell wall biosynthesis
MNPRVSIVLPVFNGAKELPETLKSILGQTEPDYELIVIDDGSTDATASILADQAARDQRIRLLRQRNLGLTQALIRGCAAARGSLLARHDCGDVSHPDRLRLMANAMAENASCMVMGCGVTFAGPEGELLYATTHSGVDVRASLLRAANTQIVGLPAGAAAVMRADAYRLCGGYRPEFYFAQDLDLWIRMAALGDVRVMPELLYEARMGIRAISSVHRPEQIALASLAVALRDSAGEDQRLELLREAALIRPAPRSSTRRGEAKALYFIAACLQRRSDPRWRRYASRALRRQPLAIRPWLLFLRGAMI